MIPISVRRILLYKCCRCQGQSEVTGQKTTLLAKLHWLQVTWGKWLHLFLAIADEQFCRLAPQSAQNKLYLSWKTSHSLRALGYFQLKCSCSPHVQASHHAAFACVLWIVYLARHRGLERGCPPSWNNSSVNSCAPQHKLCTSRVWQQ